MSIVSMNRSVIMMKLKAEETKVAFVQACMPTSSVNDKDIKEIYLKLDELVEAIKKDELLIIIGDQNAVVREQEEGTEVGKYSIGNENKRGKRLNEFYK